MSDDRPFLVYRRLLGCLAGSGGRLALALLALGVNAAALLVIPWLIKDLYQDAVVAAEATALHLGLAAIVGAFLIMGASRYVADDQLEIVTLRLLERLRAAVVAKLVRLPVSYLAEGRAGTVIARAMNDVQAVRPFLRSACFALANDLFRIAGSVVMLLVLSWRLALITLAMMILGGSVVALTARWTRRRFQRVQAALADMTSVVTEQVHTLPAIRAYGAEDYEQRRFAACAGVHAREAIRGHRRHFASQAVLNLLAAIALALVLGVGAVEIRAGQTTGAGLTLGQLLGFAVYAALLGEPLARLGRTNLEVQQVLAAARQVFAFLDRAEEDEVLPPPSRGRVRVGGPAQRDPHDSVSSSPPPQPSPVKGEGVLQFQAVSFAYRDREPVLANIDLRIQPGETTALVGPSGAGKSTLSYLVLRFQEPTAGRVLLDGQDLRAWPRSDLRRHIGWLGQEPFILSGTVAENIRYGSWEAPDTAVVAAARLACADDFVRALPQGYATRVGERGVDLSGGERARLAMARVILRDPSIVLLDEVTAALDAETEARLWHNLKDWLAERTAVIIAHRLFTVLGCPRIVVLEVGRVVGDGTAADLLANCTTFQRLFREQVEGAARAA